MDFYRKNSGGKSSNDAASRADHEKAPRRTPSDFDPRYEAIRRQVERECRIRFHTALIFACFAAFVAAFAACTWSFGRAQALSDRVAQLEAENGRLMSMVSARALARGSDAEARFDRYSEYLRERFARKAEDGKAPSNGTEGFGG